MAKSSEKLTMAKYLGAELTNYLKWGPHVHIFTAKANRTSAFTHRNLGGSPITVQTKCYKGIVRPILEYSAPVWDPH